MCDPVSGIFRTLKTPLLIVGFILFNIASYACSCTVYASVQKNYETASVVFTGKVIKTEFVTLNDTMDADSLGVAKDLIAATATSKNFLTSSSVLKATIVVSDDFKGTMKNDTIVVYTGIRGASCGFKFEQNKEYVVYASTEIYMAMFMQGDRDRFRKLGQSGTYWTNICTRTTATVGAEQGALREITQRK